MEKKYIFLDIDGTLCNEIGEISNSTVEAIRRAKANGHLVFLCTGRSKQGIYDKLIEMDFDGIVGSAGAYVEIGGDVIYHKPMKKADVAAVVDFFNYHNIKFILETNACNYATISSQEFVYYALKDGRENIKIEELLGIIKTIENDSVGNDVNKILYFDSPYSAEKLRGMLNDKYTVINSTIELLKDDSGELSGKGISKATGIDFVLKHYGANKQDTVAIGDGSNDVEMLQHAAISVAMGNAVDYIKDIADYVTASVEEDGIYKAFEKFGLI